jgi:hypothetical protein
MTTIERAFDLARSGKFTSITEVITTLAREGYVTSQIEGPLLKRQLKDLIKAVSPKPPLKEAEQGPLPVVEGKTGA